MPPPQTYQLDESLHTELWRLNARRAAMKQFPIFVGIVLILAGLLYVLGGNQGKELAIGGLIGLCLLPLIFWIAYGFILPRRSAAVFHETVNLREPQTISFDADGFRVDLKSGHSRHEWSHIAKWDESDRIMAVYINRILAYILPKDQVSPEVIGFVRQQLIETGLTKPGKPRK